MIINATKRTKMTEEQIEDIDTSEETPEVEEVESTDSTPTLEDYQRLQKENATLKAQKEHFKKKAQTKETLTTNTSGDLLEMQKEILAAKGFGEATLEQAQRLSTKLGISIFEAVKDPLIAKFAEAESQEIKIKKAQLGASNGTGDNSKSAIRQGMTEEEHRAAWEKSRSR